MNDTKNNMKITELDAKMKQCVAISEVMKHTVKGIVEEARMLMDEDRFHAWKEESLEAATNFNTIQEYLNEFERLSFGSKRFAVARKK